MSTIKRRLTTLLTRAALPIAAIASFANSANAAPVFDTSLAPPGVYYGSGNSNTHFVTSTASNVELGLGTVRRYLGPVTPDAGTSVYHVQTGVTGVAGKTGADWGFEFSINTNANGRGELGLTNYTNTLCVQDVGAGTTNCFNPLLIADNAHASAATAQNSEALQFLNGTSPDTRFFDPSFDINANDTYVFTLNAFGFDQALADSVQMTDIAGTGAPGAPVPEPVSMALFGLGLAGVGWARRRKGATPSEAV